MKQLLLMFKTTGICALLICTAAFTASAQEKISLQKAVDLALANNLTIKQSAFTEALDAATYQQSKNNQLPSLSSSISASENFGRALDVSTYQYTSNRSVFAVNPSVSAQVMLFQGGQLRNVIIQNRMLVDVDRSGTAKIKNDLVLNVVVDYLQILTNMDLVTAANQQIAITKLTRDRTDISVKAGQQTMADLSQATAGVSTAEYNLITAQNQLDLSVLILKQYMEMPASTEIIVEKPDISKITDVKTSFVAQDIIATALNVNPDVKLAEAQQAVYAQAIKIAQGGYYPSLSVFSGLSSNYSSVQKEKVIGLTSAGQPIYGPYTFGSQLNDNFSQAIGLSLQIPIFNKFTTRTNVKKAKISYQNAEITTQIAKNNLTKIIFQAVLDAKASERQYQSSLQTYQANKDAFNIIQQRYTVGLVNSLDYNTSLTTLNKSENDMILARYQMVFRSKVIDYYLGNPIIL